LIDRERRWCRGGPKRAEFGKLAMRQRKERRKMTTYIETRPAIPSSEELATAREMYAEVDPEGVRRNARRILKLARVIMSHPEARVEFCADESTGRRYGRAACRAGR